MSDLCIRPAREADLPALNAIFNHYVMHSHSTFRTEPWSLEERRAWFRAYDGGRHHVLVGVEGEWLVGCAYSSRYRPTPPFDATVELSIYLDPECRRAGTGTALLTALLDHLQTQPVHLALSGIALPNDASIALHRKLGFEEVGTFREYAQKDGVWISSVWFQRRMAPIG